MYALFVNGPALLKSGQSFIDSVCADLTTSQRYSVPMEHLGLMAAKSCAKARGVEAHVIDGIVERHDSLDTTKRQLLEEERKFGEPILIGLQQRVRLLLVTYPVPGARAATELPIDGTGRGR